jgi:hypothetical protein
MEQTILLPDASMLLVHKGWGLGKKKATESTSINVSTKGVQPVTMRQKNGALSTSSRYSSINFEFVSMDISPADNIEKPKRRKKHGTRRTRQVSTNVTRKVSKMDGEALGQKTFQVFRDKNEILSKVNSGTSQSLQLSSVCSGSTSAFYGDDFPVQMNQLVFSLMNICKLSPSHISMI